MKKIFAGFILMMSMNATAQTAYDITKDTESEAKVFNGPITFNDLDKEATFDWLKDGYGQYKPDHKIEGYLKDHLRDYKLVIFMGTWCYDSHVLVPKLEKVLKDVGYPMDQVTMYGTDRKKHTKNGEHAKYKITNVPTIILVKNNNEAGRITEEVERSVEQDLATIIERDIRK